MSRGLEPENIRNEMYDLPAGEFHASAVVIALVHWPTLDDHSIDRVEKKRVFYVLFS